MRWPGGWPLGIAVTAVAPGACRTDFPGIRVDQAIRDPDRGLPPTRPARRAPALRRGTAISRATPSAAHVRSSRRSSRTSRRSTCRSAAMRSTGSAPSSTTCAARPIPGRTDVQHRLPSRRPRLIPTAHKTGGRNAGRGPTVPVSRKAPLDRRLRMTEHPAAPRCLRYDRGWRSPGSGARRVAGPRSP